MIFIFIFFKKKLYLYPPCFLTSLGYYVVKPDTLSLPLDTVTTCSVNFYFRRLLIIKTDFSF